MRTFAAALTASWIAAATAAAQPPAPPPAASPMLVVTISVDQLSADLFAEYRPHLQGGFRRLSQGALFPSAYHAHAATETCPGHATLLTGARPARTGIIANEWYDPRATREDKTIYCAEDERVAGSTSRDHSASPYHLRVPTLGDYLKVTHPQSRVVAVAGKDRAAVMMGGRNPDQSWWWDDEAFVTNTARPAAMGAAINRQIAAALTQPRPPLELPFLCAPLGPEIPFAGGMTIGTHRFGRAAQDKEAFRVSPDLDGATLALAAALREEMRLGQGPSPDLLAIGLSATDFVGHSYGTQGAEMCLQLLALDRELDDFFHYLDSTGTDYLVMLTADHGGEDVPERLRQQGITEAVRVDPALVPAQMGRTLAAKLGLAGPLLHGAWPFGNIYVDGRFDPATRVRVRDEAMRAYRVHPQVAEVFTAEQIRAAPPPSGPPDRWTLLARAKASFDPERSGDLVVLLKPHVTPIANPRRGIVATHGSPWDYDRRVPLMFWRKGIAPLEQTGAVETVDIAPTLASVLGISLPAGLIDGRCLDIIVGAESNCR